MTVGSRRGARKNDQPQRYLKIIIRHKSNLVLPALFDPYLPKGSKTECNTKHQKKKSLPSRNRCMWNSLWRRCCRWLVLWQLSVTDWVEVRNSSLMHEVHHSAVFLSSSIAKSLACEAEAMCKLTGHTLGSLWRIKSFISLIFFAEALDVFIPNIGYFRSACFTSRYWCVLPKRKWHVALYTSCFRS